MSWTIKDVKAKGLQIIGDQDQIAISIKSNPGPSKYKNKRVEVDGHFFDSKKEAGRYGMLKLMQKNGMIRDLRMQVIFKLSVCKYIADFVYWNVEEGREVVEDTKGMKTQVYLLKMKLMEHEMGIKILET